MQVLHVSPTGEPKEFMPSEKAFHSGFTAPKVLGHGLFSFA
jgi:hypothetical protein